jgi:hypothetical protein
MNYNGLSCNDIARYFLAQIDEEAGDLISNMKLQKLVYYAQGVSLALHNRPLFPESLEAWTYVRLFLNYSIPTNAMEPAQLNRHAIWIFLSMIHKHANY